MNLSQTAADRVDGAPGAAVKPADPRAALQGFILLDAFVRLLIWSKAIALTTAAFTALGAWPEGGLVGADLSHAWRWGERLAQWVVLYNFVYVGELIVLRLLVPMPKEGEYSMAAGRRLDRQLLWSSLIAVLTKARYEAPFPGFLVFHIASLPPMRWLMGPVFGPRSRSCNVTDPLVLDPHLVRIGRNVVIGYDAIICGHHQGRASIVINRTTIEDDVLIGARSLIFGGVHLKSGSVIGAGAVVLPDTVVGPNELWAGIPAKKICGLNTSPPAAAR